MKAPGIFITNLSNAHARMMMSDTITMSAFTADFILFTSFV